MIRDIKEQKATVTKGMTEAITKYYEIFEKSSNQTEFDINKIERLMIENQREIKKLMEEANSKLVSSIEIEPKKNVPNVEK